VEIGDLVVKTNGMHEGKLGVVVWIYRHNRHSFLDPGVIDVLVEGRVHKWYMSRVILIQNSKLPVQTQAE